MKTEGVQECRKTLHDTQDGNGEEEPHGKHDYDEYGVSNDATFVQERAVQRHIVQHLGQLGVSERQSPKTEIRCTVCQS